MPFLLSSSPKMLSSLSRLSKLSSLSSLSPLLQRPLSVSSPNSHRQLLIREQPKELSISAEPLDTAKDEKKRLKMETVGKKHCHALCRLPFVHEIKHTDVLILEQFMDVDGRILDRDVLGLCRRQHVRMSKLIKMAQKAGLMPRDKDIYADEKGDDLNTPWAENNCYWDEKTIDIQWRNTQWKKYRAQFP